jgi:hypothetical protein
MDAMLMIVFSAFLVGAACNMVASFREPPEARQRRRGLQRRRKWNERALDERGEWRITTDMTT